MAYPPKQANKSVPVAAPEVTTKLDARRLQKLLTLKKREELKDVLVARFKEKAAKKDAKSDDVINHEVSKFIHNVDISEGNLSRLERRIDKKLEESHKADDQVSVVSGVSDYSTRTKEVVEAIPTTKPVASREEADPSLYDWSRLDEYAGYIAQQDSQRQKQELQSIKQRIKGDLDRQVIDARARKNREKEEELKFARNLSIESRQWEEYERKVSEDRRVKAEKEKQDRDEQMHQAELRRRKEEERREAEATLLLEKINREIQEEKTKILAKKEGQKRLMTTIMKENEEEKKLKDEESKRQQELDIAAMIEYNNMLEKQDSIRAGDTRARLEKQKLLMERMKEKVMMQQTAKDDEDNVRALKQSEEAEQRASQLDALKKHRLTELQKSMVDVLQRQVSEKAETKKQQNALRSFHSQILAEDTREFKQEEKKRAEGRRQQLLEYKKDLESQIENKNKERESVKKYEMSSQERQLNKKLLQVVNRVMTEKEEESLASASPKESPMMTSSQPT